ncbi:MULTISPECIES: AAA family ATPase [unclassified Moraxella]|uniref:AAA family ATPase n=1 Tax=unclassified Moraxella TaxID=2685852 RepID=UPI003AF92535
MQLIIFIGLQGSGKSTFYKQHLVDSHIRLNGDMLKTKHRETLLFHACLTSKTPTVIDKTNATIAERQPLIALAKQQHFNVIAYYFDVPFAIALAQNNHREGKAKVPEVGVKSTAKKLQPPQFSEGFDQIFYVKVQDNLFELIELKQELLDEI